MREWLFEAVLDWWLDGSLGIDGWAAARLVLFVTPSHQRQLVLHPLSDPPTALISLVAPPNNRLTARNRHLR